MLTIFDEGSTLCDGLTRREWIRLGSLGLGGISLTNQIAARRLSANETAANIAPSFGRAKSVILFWLTGGPAQQET